MNAERWNLDKARERVREAVEQLAGRPVQLEFEPGSPVLLSVSGGDRPLSPAQGSLLNQKLPGVLVIANRIESRDRVAEQ